LHNVWRSPGLVHYCIDSWRFLTHNGILRDAKFILHLRLVLLYWQRYCTAVEQWASAKLCGVQQRAPPIFVRAAITLGIGPHSSFVCCFNFFVFRTSAAKQKILSVASRCLLPLGGLRPNCFTSPHIVTPLVVIL